MIKFQITDSIKEGSVPLLYIKGPQLDSTFHIAMNNEVFHKYVPENRTQSILPTTISIDGTIEDTNPIMASKSMMLPKTSTPRPLWYKHQVGKNHPTDTLYLYHKTASGTGEDAKQQIKSSISVYDHERNEVNINWDIEIESYDAASSSYEINLYTDRRSSERISYMISYDAIDRSTSRIYRNHFEFINSYQYVWFTPKIDTSNGDILIDSISEDKSDCIGLYFFGPGTRQYEITSTTIELEKQNPADPWNSITIDGKSTAELCSEINNVDIFFHAVPLNDTILNDNELDIVGPADCDRNGRKIQIVDHINVSYLDNAKIKVDLLGKRNEDDMWFLKINNGMFLKTFAGDDYIFTLSDDELDDEFRSRYWTTATIDAGHPWKQLGSYIDVHYRDAIKKSVLFVDYEHIMLFDKKIIPESLKVYVDDVEVTSSISDIDVFGGRIKLDMQLDPNKSIKATYAYMNDRYEYRELNLNPRLRMRYTDKYNVNIFQKYIGIYMKPLQKVNGYKASRTIYHTIHDSYYDLLDYITEINKEGENAVLLAITQLRDPYDMDDIEILDIRQAGGRLKDGLNIKSLIKKNPEVEFFAPGHARIGGLEYPASGINIINLPQAIIEETDFDDTADDPELDDDEYADPTGRLTTKKVQEIVKKHTAVGHLSIVEYYDD